MFLKYSNVINKNLIYSDRVSLQKDYDIKSKLNIISNVKESDLEDCISMIFNNNQDVLFYYVQYSRSNKMLYFYTDKSICKKCWDDRNKQSLISNDDCFYLLNEFLNILDNNNIYNENYISLYDLIIVMRKRYTEYHNIKNNFLILLDKKLNPNHNKTNHRIFEIKRFNFNKMEIIIRCNDHNYSEDIVIGMKNNSLYVKGFCPPIASSIFLKCGNMISKFFDCCIKYQDIIKPKSDLICTDNEKFNIHMNHCSIFIGSTAYPSVFGLAARIDSDEYHYYCSPDDLVELFKGNEKDILSKIYVKINDCHEATLDVLYDVRKKQLVKEEKKEKRLALRKKILHF